MVLIGTIIRTRGNRGELVVSLSPGAAAPAEGSAVELRSSKRAFPQTLERVAIAGDNALFTLSGAHSISEGLRFVGCTVWAAGPLPKANHGSSVLGFKVFDGQGEFWGTVRAQPQFSLNQVLEIEDASGATIYVPWHDQLVTQVDRRARSIVIDPPAGLRDLNK